MGPRRTIGHSSFLGACNENFFFLRLQKLVRGNRQCDLRDVGCRAHGDPPPRFPQQAGQSRLSACGVPTAPMPSCRIYLVMVLGAPGPVEISLAESGITGFCDLRSGPSKNFPSTPPSAPLYPSNQLTACRSCRWRNQQLELMSLMQLSKYTFDDLQRKHEHMPKVLQRTTKKGNVI